MKKFLLGVLFMSISLVSLAKSWPSSALSQLKQNPGIQVDCSFLSAMLGRDMSNDYPQRLLQAYKNAYPDYANFENYAIRYRNTADPIRMNILKSSVRYCDFSSVWSILERNSPAVTRMRSSDSAKYNRLKSITLSKLQTYFKSVENFVEQMCLYPSSTDATLERIAEESVSQLNSTTNSTYGSYNSYSSARTISVPSNRIDTDTHTWRVSSVEFGNDKTIVYKQVTPKQYQTWVSSDSREFIEDTETGRKYYITGSSIGFDGSKVLNGTSPFSFSESYPQMPSSVRYINISSGGQYYVRNLRIR